MPKPLLALALVVTQLLSWSVPPVFLCLESDGSVCIDSGPENCDCCHVDRSTHEHFRAGDDSAGHDHGSVTETGWAESEWAETEWSADDGPCGCTHIQISEQQSPVVLSPAAAVPPGPDAIQYVTTVACGNLAAVGLDAISAQYARSTASLWPQCERFSVVLRC